MSTRTRSIGQTLVRSILLVVIVASRAGAFDVTACGQTVPRDEIGVLQVDLLCAPDVTGVYVEQDAELHLNGNTVGGGVNSIECIGQTGSCTVRGPGSLNGAAFNAIDGRPYNLRKAVISDLTISDTGAGAISPSAKLLVVSNVIVERSNLDAPTPDDGTAITGARRIVVSNVSVLDSSGWALGGYSVKGSGLTLDGNGRGMDTPKIRLDNASVTNSAGVGVHTRGRVVFNNSTFAGNGGVDLITPRIPALSNTTCERSQVCKRENVATGCTPVVPEQTWSVCTNDF